MTSWKLGAATLSLVLLTCGGVQAQQQQPGQRPGQAQRTGQATWEAQPQPDVVSIALFMLADANNDGQISMDEAKNIGYQVVGGIFFRADADGDGVVTQEEARQIRQEILERQPLLRVFVEEVERRVEQAEDTPDQTPFEALASLLNTENPREIKAAEAREAVDNGVEMLFQTVDTNRDGQLSPEELQNAGDQIAEAAQDALFNLVDADGDGQISKEEFEQAVLEPARVIFGMVDANNDGQLTREELQQAQQFLAEQMTPAIPRFTLPPIGVGPQQRGFGSPTRPRAGQPGQ